MHSSCQSRSEWAFQYPDIGLIRSKHEIAQFLGNSEHVAVMRCSLIGCFQHGPVPNYVAFDALCSAAVAIERLAVGAMRVWCDGHLFART